LKFRVEGVDAVANMSTCNPRPFIEQCQCPNNNTR
jgi:hypothetical protein